MLNDIDNLTEINISAQKNQDANQIFKLGLSSNQVSLKSGGDGRGRGPSGQELAERSTGTGLLRKCSTFKKSKNYQYIDEMDELTVSERLRMENASSNSSKIHYQYEEDDN